MTSRSDTPGSAPPPAGRRERNDRRPAAVPVRPEIAPRTSDAARAVKPTQFDPSSWRAALIATAAYYRAEKRGFAPGYEQEDWLAAEREVDGAGNVPAG